MWNSNSVVSWLLARSGLPMEAIQPPAGGRTPGWAAGLITALREPSEERAARHSSGADTTPVAGSGRRCCIQSGRGTPKQQPTYRIRSPGRVRRPRRSAAGSLVPRRPGRSDLAEGSGRTHARRSRRQRCGRVLEAAHWSQPRLHSAMVGLEPVVGVLVSAVPGRRQQLLQHQRRHRRPVGDDLDRRHLGGADGPL
jgi:hypothetical protein